jgi:CreA protein
VVALADPLVDGVTVYLSDFKRSVSAKLSSGDIFSEPSQTSLACVRDDSRPGGVQITGDLGGREGKEMFAERKNMNLLNNKVLRIRRVYDAPRNTLVYVSYSTRTSSADAEGPSAGQYKTSVCAVPLKPGEVPNAPEVK